MAAAFPLEGALEGWGDVGTLLWVDLGLIPVGFRYWFGYGLYYADIKTIAFELRTNLPTKSLGNDLDTALIDLASARAGRSYRKDMYQKGRKHKVSEYGSGVERLWLKVKAKQSALSYFDYDIGYATE